MVVVFQVIPVDSSQVKAPYLNEANKILNEANTKAAERITHLTNERTYIFNILQDLPAGGIENVLDFLTNRKTADGYCYLMRMSVEAGGEKIDGIMISSDMAVKTGFVRPGGRNSIFIASKTWKFVAADKGTVNVDNQVIETHGTGIVHQTCAFKTPDGNYVMPMELGDEVFEISLKPVKDFSLLGNLKMKASGFGNIQKVYIKPVEDLEGLKDEVLGRRP